MPADDLREAVRGLTAINAARPVVSASAAVNAAKRLSSTATRSLTVAADNAATAAIGPTMSTRELPSAA